MLLRLGFCRQLLGLLPWTVRSKLRLMLDQRRLSALSLVVIVSIVLTGEVQAQSAPGSDTQTGVSMSKLSEPIYPRLASFAHISGDVILRLAIPRDGTVESAEAISGHPMLKQAALDSVQRSQFECRNRGESGTLYSLTYKISD
jgi:TonB family protein